MIVKHVGVLSLGKVMGVLYAGIGVIGGLFVAMMSSMGGGTFHQAGLGMGFGVGAIILFPILYGILGFIGGLLCAWLYNIAAGFIGGVELDLQ